MTFRTRIAPTPSGYLHIGNIFSFYLTRIIADKYKGSVTLRIDDLDNERNRPEYLQDIFESLQYLDIRYDNGPRNADDFLANYSQRLKIAGYHQIIEKIIGLGQAYACTCSRKQIHELVQQGIMRCDCAGKKLSYDRNDAAIRVLVPRETEVIVQDVLKGEILIKLFSELGDFVIRRRDGIPAYQVASLVDDTVSGINYIVRGEDLEVSTAAQLYLAKITGLQTFSNCRFLHHALLTDEKGQKLSKSIGSNSIRAMRLAGIKKNDILKIVKEPAQSIFNKLNP